MLTGILIGVGLPESIWNWNWQLVLSVPAAVLALLYVKDKLVNYWTGPKLRAQYRFKSVNLPAALRQLQRDVSRQLRMVGLADMNVRESLRNVEATAEEAVDMAERVNGVATLVVENGASKALNVVRVKVPGIVYVKHKDKEIEKCIDAPIELGTMQPTDSVEIEAFVNTSSIGSIVLSHNDGVGVVKRDDNPIETIANRFAFACFLVVLVVALVQVWSQYESSKQSLQASLVESERATQRLNGRLDEEEKIAEQLKEQLANQRELNRQLYDRLHQKRESGVVPTE